MSDKYIQKASSSTGLAQHESEILQDIQATFNISPIYGIPNQNLFLIRYNIESENPQALFLRNPRTSGGRFLSPHQRIFVVNNIEWKANPHITGHPDWRACSQNRLAAILLHENGDNKNSWCRKTLIHEILHSVSLYTKIWDRFPSTMRLHRFFNEGITECLTGYILFKRHKACYEGWHSNQLSRCSISYKQHVRLWCSFCQCVGVKDLAQFYLSTLQDPVQAWNQLAQAIHADGFTDFKYQLNPVAPFNEGELRQICINSFPDFKEIYESLTKSLDFARIK